MTTEQLSDDLATQAFWLERSRDLALTRMTEAMEGTSVDPYDYDYTYWRQLVAKLDFAIDTTWRALHELERLAKANDGLTRQILNDLFAAPAFGEEGNQ